MSIFSTDHCAEDNFVAAHVAFASGDHAAARSRLDAIRGGRASISSPDITFEALMPEAWLLNSMNMPEDARDLLDPTLQLLQFMEPGGLDNIAGAGTLARVCLLRAQIANTLGDTETARIWAAAFVELWRNADKGLQPLTRQAERLAAGRSR